jgi:hypothetical protein
MVGDDVASLLTVSRIWRPVIVGTSSGLLGAFFHSRAAVENRPAGTFGAELGRGGLLSVVFLGANLAGLGVSRRAFSPNCLPANTEFVSCTLSPLWLLLPDRAPLVGTAAARLAAVVAMMSRSDDDDDGAPFAAGCILSPSGAAGGRSRAHVLARQTTPHT